MPPKKTNNQFLQQAQAIHGNEYKYLSEYQGATKLIQILHVECGREFYMIPDKHINSKQKCSHCFGPKKKTHAEFLREAKVIHGDKYEYICIWSCRHCPSLD